MITLKEKELYYEVIEAFGFSKYQVQECPDFFRIFFIDKPLYYDLRLSWKNQTIILELYDINKSHIVTEDTSFWVYSINKKGINNEVWLDEITQEKWQELNRL